MRLSRPQIQAIVEQHQLSFLGIVSLETDDLAFQRYETWLQSARHAGMSYLENHKPIRHNPGLLLEGAKSAVIVGLHYASASDQEPAPQIAKYARLKDYHKLLKTKGTQILNSIMTEVPQPHLHAGRVVVDSAPILERALAAKTNSGFIGKNTCFIRPEEGSFLLLSEILLTIPFEPDVPSSVDPKKRDLQKGGCGTCQRCQSHCPTGALNEAYKLDANLCLAYWSIENRGLVPLKFWPWFEKYFFGCDICQNVCPYNRGKTPKADFQTQKIGKLPPLEDIVFMDQEFYEREFGGTALTRAKRDGLRRNALIALVASKHAELDVILKRAKDDASELIRQTVDQAKEYLSIT